MNKLPSVLVPTALFGALAVSSTIAAAVNNPGMYFLSKPGTVAQVVNTFDGLGDQVNYTASLSTGGVNINVSLSGFNLNGTHTYFTQVLNFACSLSGPQPGLPYNSITSNGPVWGNQTHACSLFYLGDQSYYSKGGALIL